MVKKKSIAVWAGMTDRAMTYRRTRWTERRARRRKKVSQEEAALKAALMPLIANRDGHFRAGRHTHAFGLHLSMRLANGFVARHCI